MHSDTTYWPRSFPDPLLILNTMEVSVNMSTMESGESLSTMPSVKTCTTMILRNITETLQLPYLSVYGKHRCLNERMYWKGIKCININALEISGLYFLRWITGKPPERCKNKNWLWLTKIQTVTEFPSATISLSLFYGCDPLSFTPPSFTPLPHSHSFTTVEECGAKEWS